MSKRPRIALSPDSRLVDSPGIQDVLARFQDLTAEEAGEMADVVSDVAANQHLSPKKREWAGTLAFALRWRAKGLDPASAVAFLDHAGPHRN